MNPQNITLQDLAKAYEQLQQQFTNAQNQIVGLQNQLAATQNVIKSGPSTKSPKPRKPDSFNGKGSIESWMTHMSNYVKDESEENAMAIAISYLEGPAHDWWIGHSQTEEGQLIQTWTALKSALASRFITLNKAKIARDKLAKWKQMKDVSSFNDDFQRIVLDIPNISIEEQIDRYTRGLKAYIWKELCTREYTSLNDAMRDAERVESAHKRIGKPAGNRRNDKGDTIIRKTDGPVPMELGNFELKKLTPAERELCRKEGRCYRCRQKGHLANKCPKGKGN